MFIKCINNSSLPPTTLSALTIGRVYEVIGEDGVHYRVKGDTGIIQGFYKTRFVITNEKGQQVSLIELKINEIKSRREKLGYRW